MYTFRDCPEAYHELMGVSILIRVPYLYWLILFN